MVKLTNARTSRTINPLHFEDLDPKRFEDLVRQLIYDFRNWTQLEATGRSGSDGSFDARGWESYIASDNDSETDDPATRQERLWLNQCKREKEIGPKKIEGYAKEVLKTNKDLHGVLFVASCDLSLAARNKFRTILLKAGIKEVYIWGRGELEDQLFRPENDHLLYAYFGFSLVVRSRTKKTYLRSKLATKKKLIKTLGPVNRALHKEILVRDASDKAYPIKKDVKDFDKHPRWRLAICSGHYHDGIMVLRQRSYAYIDDTGKKWDVIEGHDISRPMRDPWNKEDDSRVNYWEIWDQVPKKNKAWLVVEAAIPYENILAIDEDGDEICSVPHIYIQQQPDGKFFKGTRSYVRSDDNFNAKTIRNLKRNDKRRVQHFKDLKTPQKQKGADGNNQKPGADTTTPKSRNE